MEPMSRQIKAANNAVFLTLCYYAKGIDAT